jgi:hypothetical protein
VVRIDGPCQQSVVPTSRDRPRPELPNLTNGSTSDKVVPATPPHTPQNEPNSTKLPEAFDANAAQLSGNSEESLQTLVSLAQTRRDVTVNSVWPIFPIAMIVGPHRPGSSLHENISAESSMTNPHTGELVYFLRPSYRDARRRLRKYSPPSNPHPPIDRLVL